MPEHFDFLHVRHEKQLAAKQLRGLIELGVGEIWPGQGEENPENVTKVVDDNGRTRPRRQTSLGVRNLTPKFIPDLRQRMTIVFVPDGDRDRTASALRA